MSWFPFRLPSAADPGEVGRNLEWLEAMLQDDRAWLDAVEAEVSVDAPTEIGKVVKRWAYDAEDVLDEWKFEQLRAEPNPARARWFGRRYARDPAAQLLMDPSFQRRVNALKRRREVIGEFHHTLRIWSSPGQRRHSERLKPRATSSFAGEQQIHGRGDDKEIFVEFLLDEDKKQRLSVVPIVGAAGVGKTTLVQHIYNDPGVSGHFKVREWVSASRSRDMMELMNAIAESLAGVRCSYSQLGAVQVLLKRKIDGQKFLLVLDDVRYETIDGDRWDMLRATVNACAYGSVIILTTQDERVADRTGTLPNYILESLSGDPCWLVFQKHAFGSLCADPLLAEIGQKIAKECQGSPLVAKALGIRLRHERNAQRWRDFLQRGMWVEVMPELKLSYPQLPAILKRCFVYCSMFPRGYLFNREELVRLWMAQGFIEEKRGRLLEDVGIKYFEDLSTMSFFQKSEVDTGAFVMPNLLHALAQSISDGECIATENSKLSNLSTTDLQKAHHVSLTPSNGELSTEFLSSALHLRSFLVVPTWPLKDISRISLPDEAFHCLNRLRVLDVRHTDIRALPNTIGNLKHLRYLNLSGTRIENVHASVFQLYNLQTLDLSCTEIRELPGTIGSLSNLLHLRLNVTKITKLPESIGNLSKLQSLHLGGTKIEELPETIGSLKWLKILCLNVGKIQRLPQSICELSSLQTLELQGADDTESNNNVVSIDRDLEGQLNEQNDESKVNQDVEDMADSSLSSLYIDDQDSSSNVAIREENACESLQPYTTLRKLDIRFYVGERFLMWMGNPSFSQLTHVVIKNCMKCKTPPQLGQLPLLKKLDIIGMPFEHVGKEFCCSGGKNGFPSLVNLSFENMSKWKEWDGVEKGDFPHLDELIFFNCPKLRGVPCLHSPLTKLKVERCALKSIPTTKTLQDLELFACDDLVAVSDLPSLPSLCNLTIMYCQSVKCLPSLPSLENFWIEECEHLSLPDELKTFVLSSTTFAR